MRWLAIGALLIAGVAASVLLAIGSPRPEVVIDAGERAVAGATPGSATSGMEARPSAGLLTVDVDGAVLRPGLVSLAPGSRIGDAVAEAGGFAPSADAAAAARINLAAPVSDGDQVTVPLRGSDAVVSATPSPGAAVGATGPAGPMDLDHATAAELDTLPGIGPATAAKILAARDEAPFQQPDDLLSRKIVGPATFEKIKGLVTADGR
jgi:competence protein ComEA